MDNSPSFLQFKFFDHTASRVFELEPAGWAALGRYDNYRIVKKASISHLIGRLIWAKHAPGDGLTPGYLVHRLGAFNCGDSADTIEHMPPKQMFIRKQRPKGLEFSSCQKCNNGTGKSDLVASLLGRLSVDPSADDEAAEFKKLLSAVRNNVPGLLEEMQIDPTAEKLERKDLPIQEGGGILRANGPLVTKHMLVFGAKLGFALHYEALRKVVPPTGGVQPRWFSNAQAARGEIPTGLFSLLPDTGQTLKQGSRDVSDQFQYAWALLDEGTPEPQHALFYATFHRSFAIAVVSATDRTAFIEKHADRFPLVLPGAFRS